MKAKIAICVLYVAWLIAAVLLVFAPVETQSDNFYTSLRWVCCVAFVYSAAISFQIKRMLWLCVFVVLAVLFNPIVVLPLDRSVWIMADWFSIAAMIIATFVFWKVPKN